MQLYCPGPHRKVPGRASYSYKCLANFLMVKSAHVRSVNTFNRKGRKDFAKFAKKAAKTNPAQVELGRGQAAVRCGRFLTYVGALPPGLVSLRDAPQVAHELQSPSEQRAGHGLWAPDAEQVAHEQRAPGEQRAAREL